MWLDREGLIAAEASGQFINYEWAGKPVTREEFWRLAEESEKHESRPNPKQE
jgi:hypothetical protein